jgi:hypothetical protein
VVIDNCTASHNTAARKQNKKPELAGIDPKGTYPILLQDVLAV